MDEDTISALLESANSYSHSSSNNNNPATEDDDNDEDIVEYETGDSHYQTVREDHHPRTTTEETSIVVIDENNNAAVAGDAAEVILQSEEDRQIDEEMDKLEEAVRLEGDDAAASVLMSPNTVSPISTITSSPNTNIVVHSNPETWNSAEIRVWLINNDFERFIDNFKGKKNPPDNKNNIPLFTPSSRSLFRRNGRLRIHAA